MADLAEDGRCPTTRKRQEHTADQKERVTTASGLELPTVKQAEDKTSTGPRRRHKLPRTPLPTARDSDSEFEPDWPAPRKRSVVIRVTYATREITPEWKVEICYVTPVRHSRPPVQYLALGDPRYIRPLSPSWYTTGNWSQPRSNAKWRRLMRRRTAREAQLYQ